MTSSSRTARVRICEDYRPESLKLHVPRLFRPVCRLRPATTRIALSGETLLPNWNARRALEEPRSTSQGEWGEKRGDSGDAFPSKGCSLSDSRCGGIIPPSPSPGPMALISLSVVLVPGTWRIPGQCLGISRGLRRRSLARQDRRATRWL